MEATLPGNLEREIKLPLFACAKGATSRKMSMAEITALELEIQTQEDLDRLNLEP